MFIKRRFLRAPPLFYFWAKKKPPLATSKKRRKLITPIGVLRNTLLTVQEQLTPRHVNYFTHHVSNPKSS